MNPLRIVIIGGVAGGASAAARARRLSEQAEVILIERGPHVSFANCGLPYYVGGEIAERDSLFVQTPESLKARYNLDVRIRTEAVAVDPAAKTVKLKKLDNGQTYEQPYDKLILAPGAKPIRPPLPGIDDPRIHTLRNVEDTDRIKQVVDGAAKSALVVGGGFIGLEVAENLIRRKLNVTLVEMMPQVMPPFDPEMVAPLHQALRDNGVTLILNQAVESFQSHPDRVEARLKDGRAVSADSVVLAIGVRPESDLARAAGLRIGDRGGIVVNEHLQTSDPDIYAVGDVIEVTDFVLGQPTQIPLAGPANRQGRIAADHIFGRDSKYRGSQGTCIVRVFNVAAGMTGASEKALQRAGRTDYQKVYIHPMQHAGYFPGASPLSIKLLFSKTDGRVLGGQVTGAEGVDKRVDVLATAVQAGMTVYDLEEAELAYAPQYGSAKDPINFAGFVAANLLRGDVQQIDVTDIGPDAAGPGNEGRVVLDIRDKDETDAGTVPGAKLIPLNELRTRLSELPTDKEIVPYCKIGLRGYIGYRILTQHGFAARNLAGGYLTWLAHHGPQQSMPTAAANPAPAGCASDSAPSGATKLDVSGMCCPGPLMKVRQKLETLAPGELLEVTATDIGFANDVAAWCRSTQNELVSIDRHDGRVVATIRKGLVAQPAGIPAAGDSRAIADRQTILVFSQDLDRALAAFVIANGAAAMGKQVTMFFTLWGLNILRRRHPPATRKGFLDRMFGWMMPRGVDRLRLSKMNMAGVGTALMKKVMRDKNVASLPELLETARQSGVRLIACSMSMEVMGIQPAELIDGVEMAGVTEYLSRADQARVNLFI
jgi:NADPH-dependent 2,4-dienoyl-CoA reductase/sulfur reductase-like enzyme/peroxiredoxin family protein/TusA-related sulfurtransferase/rhodanese-related sulfurtransferase